MTEPNDRAATLRRAVLDAGLPLIVIVAVFGVCLVAGSRFPIS